MFYTVFPSTLGRMVELNPVTPSKKLLDDTPFTLYWFIPIFVFFFFFFPLFSRAELLCGKWDLPGSGIKLVSPALAGRFFTTEPSGKNPHPCLISHLPSDAFWNDLLDNLYSHSSLRWSQLPGSPTYDYKCNCIKFLPFSVLLC